MQLIRKLHPSTSPGIVGLVIGGLLQLLAFYLHWPLLLVLLAQAVLVSSITWICVFDVFPIFLPLFASIRKTFPRRYSFFFILLTLFILMQLISYFLPSGRAKDSATTIAFLSFFSSAAWLVTTFLVDRFTNFFIHFKRPPREMEKVTLTDIVMSMAVVIAPSVLLSFIFSTPGLGTSQITPYQLFTSAMLTALFIGVYLYLFVIRPKIFTWKQLGLRKVDREDMGKFLVLFLLVSVLVFILQKILERVGLPIQHYSFSTTNGAWWALLGTAVVTPFVEELYFRGFLFKGLLLHQQPWVAYTVSSLLFALLHPPLAAVIEVFIIGILLAYTLKETRSIWPCVLIHALNNALVFGYLLYK
jgi:membrane protease YdiL (CAAX protease family)